MYPESIETTFINSMGGILDINTLTKAIIGSAKDNVENCVDTLFDKKNYKLCATEIANTKKYRLEDIERYENCEDDNSKFKLILKNSTDSIVFSNRTSTNNELRGNHLKNLLTNLKQTNPNLYLYDALNKIILDQDINKNSLLNYCLFAIKQTLDANDRNNQSADKINKIHSSLINIGKFFINYYKHSPIPEKILFNVFEKVLKNNKNEIIQTIVRNNNTIAVDDFSKILTKKVNFELLKLSGIAIAVAGLALLSAAFVFPAAFIWLAVSGIAAIATGVVNNILGHILSNKTSSVSSIAAAAQIPEQQPRLKRAQSMPATSTGPIQNNIPENEEVQSTRSNHQHRHN